MPLIGGEEGRGLLGSFSAAYIGKESGTAHWRWRLAHFRFALQTYLHKLRLSALAGKERR
jgi:hypothetical protein